MENAWPIAGKLDLWQTLRFSLPIDRALLRRSANEIQYSLWTGDGPATVRLVHERQQLVASATGSGAAAGLAEVPRTVGLDDDPGSFRPEPGLLAELGRRRSGLRLGSTGRVFDALLPTVIGQRVTTDEANRSYHQLVVEVAEPAPDCPGLLLPPRPEAVLALSFDDFHRLGIERSRARTIREVAKRAGRLEEITAMTREAAKQRLESVAGVGPWTSGWVMGSAWGDRDSVPIGDFHLPNTVAWVLAGEPRADDERMIELLEPYRPNRRRALLLIKMSGSNAPRYGPRSPKSIISRRGY